MFVVVASQDVAPLGKELNVTKRKQAVAVVAVVTQVRLGVHEDACKAFSSGFRGSTLSEPGHVHGHNPAPSLFFTSLGLHSLRSYYM
jgi:hypothetical protein